MLLITPSAVPVDQNIVDTNLTTDHPNKSGTSQTLTQTAEIMTEDVDFGGKEVLETFQRMENHLKFLVRLMIGQFSSFDTESEQEESTIDETEDPDGGKCHAYL